MLHPLSEGYHLRATWVLVLACVVTSAAGQAPTPGDPRQGYDSEHFATDSTRVVTAAAQEHGGPIAEPGLGLPPMPHPPPDPSVVQLGARLFFDRRLSANATLSCAMCHVPEQGFTQNELKTPVGIEGRFVRRNAPSLYNVGYVPMLFHDGRETDLAEQVWSPLLASNEMGNATREQVVQRIRDLDDYTSLFRSSFGDGVTEHSVGAALAAYQRTLLSADAPFDRWYFGGDTDAVNAAVKSGFTTFVRSGCASCHALGTGAALFTDHDFHNTGIGHRAKLAAGAGLVSMQIAPGVVIEVDTDLSAPAVSDLGREEVTGNRSDRWRYRTPSLRNVALTAPYMHDGSLPTLSTVVDYYSDGGSPHPGQDSLIQPLELDRRQRGELVAFLESLTAGNAAALAARARAAPIGDTHHP